MSGLSLPEFDEAPCEHGTPGTSPGHCIDEASGSYGPHCPEPSVMSLHEAVLQKARSLLHKDPYAPTSTDACRCDQCNIAREFIALAEARADAKELLNEAVDQIDRLSEAYIQATNEVTTYEKKIQVLEARVRELEEGADE
jgi:hypothetical protein